MKENLEEELLFKKINFKVIKEFKYNKKYDFKYKLMYEKSYFFK